MIIKKETYRYSSRMLRTVIILISVQLVIEIFSWTFDTINQPYAKVLNYGFNLLFFLMGPIIVGVFASYIDYLLFKSKERLKRRLYYMHLFILFFILAVINLFTPIIFSISETNVYQREFWMNFAFIAVFIKLFYVLFITWYNRHRLEKSIFISIFVFAFIPLIGGLLQMFFFGLLIMWAFLGLSVVIAYIFTETINSSKDYLTKLYTREIAEEFISQLVESKNDAMVFLFDIDNLKLFNDQYGHESGDLVLISFAKALDRAFPKNALVSRYGGDEFLVAIQDNHENDFKDYLNQLKENLADYQIGNNPLKYSYGAASTKDEKIRDIKSLFHACDTEMYKQKAIHKNTY
jgi:diguanylate cyclase (GGDEF)-like protein